MTQESKQFGIKPETIKTQVAEYATPSRYGIPKRKWAMTANGVDGKQYVLLGTAAELEICAEIEKGFRKGRKTTIAEAFRVQEYFMNPDKEIALDLVRKEYEEGELLVEGPSASPSIEGVRVTPERVAAWAPVELAIGEDWIIKDLPQFED